MVSDNPAIAEPEQWEVVGHIEPNDGGPRRHVALSADHARFAVLIDVLGKWSIKGGPWSYDTMQRCAEHIVAGDRRAITWPEGSLCMAAGYVALMCEAERRSKASPERSAGEGVKPAEGVSTFSSPPASQRTCAECG